MAEQLRFDDRVAIVTGAGGGLGRAYALLLAARGAAVVVNDVGSPFPTPDGAISTPSAQTTVDEILAAGGIAIVDRHDVVTQGDAVVGTALDRLGRVDIVIANAGATGGGGIGPGCLDAWRTVLDVTVDGTVAVLGAAWPHLTATGGCAVVTSSSAAFGEVMTPGYATAKSGVLGLARSLAARGRRDGVRVNAVLPSSWTRLTEMLPPSATRELMERFTPEDVAAVVAWLCHDSCNVNGEAFSVGGGRAARVVLAENAGSVVDAATPEEWARVAGDVLSSDALVVPRSSGDEVAWQAWNLARAGRPVPAAFRPGGREAWDRHPR